MKRYNGVKMSIIFSLLILLLQHSNIEIKNPWLRPGAVGMNTAMYFEIVNKGEQADTLYMVKSNLANIVELHETFKKDDMMGMRKIDYVVIKAKSSFIFKPGGNHVMLIDLKKKLKVGDTGKATLFFKKEGMVKVIAIVKK